MMEFEKMDVVPVIAVAKIAALIGRPEEALVHDYLRFPGNSGIWDNNGTPSFEYDDLYEYLVHKFPEAFTAVFG